MHKIDFKKNSVWILAKKSRFCKLWAPIYKKICSVCVSYIPSSIKVCLNYFQLQYHASKSSIHDFKLIFRKNQLFFCYTDLGCKRLTVNWFWPQHRAYKSTFSFRNSSTFYSPGPYSKKKADFFEKLA